MRKMFLLFLIVLFSAISNAQLSQEQQSIKKVFFDFLNFYQKNKEKFYSFKLYKGVGEKSGPPYEIQWKEVDRYCDWLRDSVPYVSEEYIKNERKGLNYYDSCFKTNPRAPWRFNYESWGGWSDNIFYNLKCYFDSNTKYSVDMMSDKAMIVITPASMWEMLEKFRGCNRGLLYVYFIKENGTWKMMENIAISCD